MCRYNSEEALQQLFPAMKLDLLPRHVLLHLATALGLKAQDGESRRRLHVCAQSFMTVVLAMHSWGPRAVEECRSYPASCDDDFCVQSLMELDRVLGPQTDQRKDVAKCVDGVLGRLPLLREKLSVGQPNEVDMDYKRCMRSSAMMPGLYFPQQWQ